MVDWRCDGIAARKGRGICSAWTNKYDILVKNLHILNNKIFYVPFDRKRTWHYVNRFFLSSNNVNNRIKHTTHRERQNVVNLWCTWHIRQFNDNIIIACIAGPIWWFSLFYRASRHLNFIQEYYGSYDRSITRQTGVNLRWEFPSDCPFRKCRHGSSFMRECSRGRFSHNLAHC